MSEQQPNESAFYPPSSYPQPNSTVPIHQEVPVYSASSQTIEKQRILFRYVNPYENVSSNHMFLYRLFVLGISLFNLATCVFACLFEIIVLGGFVLMAIGISNADHAMKISGIVLLCIGIVGSIVMFLYFVFSYFYFTFIKTSRSPIVQYHLNLMFLGCFLSMLPLALTVLLVFGINA